MVTQIDTATALARAGYRLAPVTIARRADGHKVGDYHGLSWDEVASSDPEVIAGWAREYGPDTSFAVVTGNPVLVVDLDLDVAAGLDACRWWSEHDLPVSPMVVDTPSGGQHHYWRMPRGPDGELLHIPNSRGSIAPGVDVRGVGGHVYAPGSRVVGEGGGQVYRLLDPVLSPHELPELPSEVLALIPERRRTRTERGDPNGNGHGPADRDVHHESWVLAQCAEQLRRVRDHPAQAGSGFRDVLMGAAMVLGRAVAARLRTREHAEERLRAEVARAWRAPADEDDERWISDGLDDGMDDPWVVLRDPPTTGLGEVGGSDSDADTDDPPDSWEPVDLGPYLDGTVEPLCATVGAVRADGQRLLYPGLEHAAIGEMESGKSWFAAANVAAELTAGHPVLYIHFEETSPADTVERLLALGVEREVIRSAFLFVGPERQ
ncbi:MAG: bifunctional DNA primase/polymerase, partial [Phycicoccus sp.]